MLEAPEAYALPENSWYMTESCQQISSVEEFEDDLKADVSVNGEWPSGSFEASAGVSSFKSEKVEKNKETFSFKSYCIQFKSAYDPTADWTKVTYEEAWKRSLKALGNVYDGKPRDDKAAATCKTKAADGMNISISCLFISFFQFS